MGQMQQADKGKKGMSPLALSITIGAIIGLVGGIIFSLVTLGRIYKIGNILRFMWDTVLSWSILTCLLGAVLGVIVWVVMGLANKRGRA